VIMHFHAYFRDTCANTARPLRPYAGSLYLFEMTG